MEIVTSFTRAVSSNNCFTQKRVGYVKKYCSNKQCELQERDFCWEKDDIKQKFACLKLGFYPALQIYMTSAQRAPSIFYVWF